MTTPADSETVLKVLCLGWYVAEVRGRNRAEAPSPGTGVITDCKNHTLPLRFERTRDEQRIEAHRVLEGLAITGT